MYMYIVCIYTCASMHLHSYNPSPHTHTHTHTHLDNNSWVREDEAVDSCAGGKENHHAGTVVLMDADIREESGRGITSFKV